ncbi:MAG: CDP-glucose 4,6-dehydratase [Methylococcaceae bacterium]|nr:MAG: CDP-glucose 4,6-dehydratase [Methylococcaceae bacterium]
MGALMSLSFWRGKRVLLTGHTGFKGAWAALWLESLGAKVTGLALAPATPLFILLLNGARIRHFNCDLRRPPQVAAALQNENFDVVLHMAAQSLVRRSVRIPQETYDVNLMGTLNLLACLSKLQRPPAVTLVITSDKVYRNAERGQPFSENDALGGDDPYSASKACVELAVQSWRSSVLPAGSGRLATARAGNVIGGGDLSEDRLIPDLIRALQHQRPMVLRYPEASRPWLYVLDALSGYLTYGEALATAGRTVPDSLNFGPAEATCVSTAALIESMQCALKCRLPILIEPSSGVAEKSSLVLNAELARASLGWQPRLTLDEAVEWSAQWYLAWLAGLDVRRIALEQIAAYSERLA